MSAFGQIEYALGLGELDKKSGRSLHEKPDLPHTDTVDST